MASGKIETRKATATGNMSTPDEDKAELQRVRKINAILNLNRTLKFPLDADGYLLRVQYHATKAFGRKRLANFWCNLPDSEEEHREFVRALHLAADDIQNSRIVRSELRQWLGESLSRLAFQLDVPNVYRLKEDLDWDARVAFGFSELGRPTTVQRRDLYLALDVQLGSTCKLTIKDSALEVSKAWHQRYETVHNAYKRRHKVVKKIVDTWLREDETSGISHEDCVADHRESLRIYAPFAPGFAMTLGMPPMPASQ